jgi:bifunctional non-homologous end joining protein LigD
MPVSPMLASPGALPAGPGWAFEFKWDGVRAIAVFESGVPRFFARSGAEITIAYPDLARIGAELGDATVDGEVVVFDADGRPSFTSLAERMHVRDRVKAARLATALPVSYLAFDLLAVGGRSLLDEPYQTRRRLLEQLALLPPAIVPPVFDDGPATVRASQENALEGVVAKRLHSTYRPGLRSPDWVKVKSEETAEFVVGGWRPGVRTIGALLVGIPQRSALDASGDGSLTYAGRCGGGISAAAERALLAALKPLEVDKSPFGASIPREDARTAHWCRPELVVEVRFGNRTPDGRLRFPRFLRIRPDMAPDEIEPIGLLDG